VPQDVSGGKPVLVEGTDGLLWGMEIDVEAAKAELREISSKDEGKGTSKFLSSIGLGILAEQLDDLKLGTITSQASHMNPPRRLVMVLLTPLDILAPSSVLDI
jgi:hypothetical protein